MDNSLTVLSAHLRLQRGEEGHVILGQALQEYVVGLR